MEQIPAFPESRRSGKSSKLSVPTLVYGQVADYLVFIEHEEAERLSACHAALWSAKTWREFRSRIHPDYFRQVLEFMEGAVSVFDFYKAWRRGKSGKLTAVARRQYLELPIGERLPDDSDPFDPQQIPFVFDGDWPDWPARQMLEWVPTWIQDKHGHSAMSAINGEFLTFSPEDAGEIVTSFRKAGFRCVRNDELVRRASGYGVDHFHE